MGLHWTEWAALQEQYGSFHVSLLAEVLRLIDDVEARLLTSNEAAVRAKSRFCDLMLQYQPECQARVTAYKERIAAEEREKNAAARGYEEKRQRAARAEAIRIEEAAKSRAAEHNAACVQQDLRQAEAARALIAEHEKQRTQKHEQENETARQAAAEAERLLRQIEKVKG